jgi:hypothetical protein
MMSTNFDPSADFSRVADNTEAVTLLRRGATPGEAGAVILHALRRAAQLGEFAAKNRDESRRYVNSNGQCVAAEVDWHLPSAELQAPPGIGDVILDGDGLRWTILELELIMLRTRWKCSARELSIAYGLDDTVTVLKAEYAKSDAGAAEPAWQTWRTGVRARIQPVEVKVGAEYSAQCATSTYRIFVEDDLVLDQTHRIRGADGTVFQIASVTGSARLGELQTIEAVKI